MAEEQRALGILAIFHVCTVLGFKGLELESLGLGLQLAICCSTCTYVLDFAEAAWRVSNGWQREGISHRTDNHCEYCDGHYQSCQITRVAAALCSPTRGIILEL